MDDADLVRRSEGRGDLNRQVENLRQGQRWQPLQPLGETLAGDILHRQVEVFPKLSDPVKRDDVRMVEAGNRPRLALEAAPVIPVLADLAQNFERDLPTKLVVEGEVE